MDLITKVAANRGSLGQLADHVHGVFSFPKLEGAIGPRMTHCGRRCLVWSLNNYLGLADHPEVRHADATAAAEYGLAAPMGSRMMSGETDHHEHLERELAEYSSKEDAQFLNYGYQGMSSVIDALVTRHDWVLYDAEAHACIIDGIRLHQGRHLAFRHNDTDHLETLLERATAMRRDSGAILVVTEGVFGMSGEQGALREIVELKRRFEFCLLVDDAHGFGIMGPEGRGSGEEQGVQDKIDLYFGTFAKAGASIGAFVAGPREAIWYLRYAARSQIFSKGLPQPIIIGNRERLRLIRTRPQLRADMWRIAQELQAGLRGHGFDLGRTNSPITPVFLPFSLPQAARFVSVLRDQYGVFCSPVVYPVVPAGVLMLRLIPTAVHTIDDVHETVDAFVCARDSVAADCLQAEPPSAYDELPDLRDLVGVFRGVSR